MAIELIKNGAAITAPVKSHQKDNINSKSFELTLTSIVETKTVESSETVTSTDRVVLTNTFTAIRRSVDSSRESSIDMDRVAQLREAIANGTYEINPDRIAMKMMHYGM